MTFAQFLKETKLELRCNTKRIAEMLQEPPKRVRSWEKGAALPDNVVMATLALRMLKHDWKLETEPFYRNLDEHIVELNTVAQRTKERRQRLKERYGYIPKQRA